MQTAVVDRIKSIKRINHLKKMNRTIMSLANDHSFTYETDGGIFEDIFKINNTHTLRTAANINVGCLSKPGFCFSPDVNIENIYKQIKQTTAITEFTVVENDAAVGFFTKAALNEILGGQYGFSLFAKSAIREVMKTDFLPVDYYMPVTMAAKLAMQRPFERLYNPIVIEKEGKYAGIVTVKDMLDACMQMTMVERDKIALMRDSLKIGLFFMDSNYIIQDQHSQYLEELLEQTNLCGKCFLDLIAPSLASKELNGTKDYFDMVIGRAFDQSTIDDINPLTELHYTGADKSCKKVFQCGFATIEQGQGEIFTLVSVYDITSKFELQQRLADEQNEHQEEMSSLFELLQVDPQVFGDFLDDTEYEFERIHAVLKNEAMSAQEIMVEIYQSAHAIKSNAVTLGINTFGNKIHAFESKIKKMREQETVTFNDMLYIATDMEKLEQAKDTFKITINKLHSYKSGAESRNQRRQTLVEMLAKTTAKICDNMGKKIIFMEGRIDEEALTKGPRRTITEVLTQLVRNAAVHGIETPEERIAADKNEAGIIKLSIKMEDDVIHIKLRDDGKGMDYTKIAEKALRHNLIKPEDMQNKDMLLKVLFLPGFSTAETEGIHAGRGIGLNLVQSRIKEAKGSIKVQSVLGKGTVFKIILPL